MPSIIVPSRARWRRDDGSEITATWLKAEDIGFFAAGDLDVNVRTRVQFVQIGGPSGGVAAQLKYSLNGAASVNVNGSSSVVRSAASTNLVEAEATTAQLTVPGSDTFVAGSVDEVNGLCGSVTLATPDYTEVEFCVQIRSADVEPGDIIDLVVFANGEDHALLRAVYYLDPTRWTNDPTRNVSALTTHDPTAAPAAGGDVFFEFWHPIALGMKPITAAGLGGVLVE